jgi:hypothetical protein
MSVALALRKALPEDAALDEIIVTGGGRHNGMLLREIGRLSRFILRRARSQGRPILPESRTDWPCRGVRGLSIFLLDFRF